MTPDAYSPAVVSSIPVAGETIEPSTAIRVRFDVDVVGVSASSFTIALAGNPSFIPGTVSYDPVMHIATYMKPGGLPPNEMLVATLTPAISDPRTGQPLQETTIDFRTGTDTTPPMVIDVDPPNGGTGAPVFTNVLVDFSEPVSTFTVTLVETVSLANVPGTTFTQGVDGALFDPTNQLAPNLGYTVRVTASDAAGNVMSPSSSTFTTGADTLQPNVLTRVPANLDTNVAVTANIVVTFDEPVMNVTTTTFQVEGGAVAGTVTMSNGNRTATFDPTASLPAATQIDVTLSAGITDTSGNALAPTAYSFTTL